MALEVLVDTDKAEELRKKLDPLANHPPTVGTNAQAPGTTILNYFGIDDELGFLHTALASGATCSKA